MEHVECVRENLSCSVDWLSWTVTEIRVLSLVLAAFGFDPADFYECEKGASGYKKMLVYHKSNIRVLYDGNANMGIHFDVSGSAIGDLLDAYREVIAEPTPFGTTAVDMDISVFQSLLSSISAVGHVTRMDLAIDNCNDLFYDLPDLSFNFSQCLFISKFRLWRELINKTTNGVKIGHTIYMGSTSSDIMLRIYDKGLEKEVSFPWIRWELQLRDKRAQQTVDLFAGGLSVGYVSFGILSNYLRLINLDDSNKSRCSSQLTWLSFIQGVEALRLYVNRDESTLEDKEEWILRQVAPTLTALIISKYGDTSFLTDHLDVHAHRMKKHLVELVDKEYPDWREALKRYAGP